jgi:hypothetical protein
MRNEVEIIAARRHDHRAAKRAPQQHRRHTVRIEIMRIDQVKVSALAYLAAQQRQDSREEPERRRAHADFWQ